MPKVAPDDADGASVVGWSASWPYGSDLPAVTLPRVDKRAIVEADILLNDADFTWTDSDRGSSGERVGAYSVLLHEVGHYLGMGHSFDPGALMHAKHKRGLEELQQDDKDGICALYGGASPVTPPNGEKVAPKAAHRLACQVSTWADSSADSHPLLAFGLLLARRRRRRAADRRRERWSQPPNMATRHLAI